MTRKSSEVVIAGVHVSFFNFPTQDPVESDGTLAWNHTSAVVIEIRAGGQMGIGYTYSDKATASLLHENLKDLIIGASAWDIPALHEKMVRRVRNIGRPGIASHAIAAADMALWDLKARLLGLPLCKLLGCARDAVPIYGSGGFISMSLLELQKELGGWVEQGIPRVKMKIGGLEKETLERVRAARISIGFGPELFVDANGAYLPRQAIALAERLAEHGVSWFEEPVSSDDLEGLAFVRQHVDGLMDIAAGEYGYDPSYFDHMSRSGSVDVAQIDATRCLGVTGFLRAAALCGSRHLPVSAHTAPQIHAHLGCAVAGLRHVEYFVDHVRIESLLFDGALKPVLGMLKPDPGRPGLGIELRRKDAQRFAA